MTLMKRFLFLPLAFYAFSNLFAQITVTNERSINSAFQEYSPAFYGNGLVFVAANPAVDKDKKEDTQIGRFTTSIFLAKRTNEGILQRPLPFAEELTTKFYDGPLSFNALGDVVFFTRSNLKKGKPKVAKDGKVKLKIYTAQLVNGQWSSISELSFCDGEADYAHPSISADGRRLFFASNRTGGQGGMDLYVSMNQNGVWGEPVNLGPKINTAKDEIFPFAHASGVLLFSTNGRKGVGGLDIFSTKQTANGWLAPTALPETINSTSDDFGLILNPERTNGYFASNRASGQGDDDIYNVSIPNGLEIIAASSTSVEDDLFSEKPKDMASNPSQTAGNPTNTEGGQNERAKLEAAKAEEAKREAARLAEFKRKEEARIAEEKKREEARIAEAKRQEALKLAEAKSAEQKLAQEKMSEQKRKDAELAEQKRLEADALEQKKVQAKIAEEKQKEAYKNEQKRAEARQAEQKREEARLAEQKKLEAKLAEKKREDDKIAEKKREDATNDMKKREEKRLADEKQEADKLAEQKRKENEAAERKRQETLSAEQKREEAKLAAAKLEEQKIAEAKRKEEQIAEDKRQKEAKLAEQKREEERIAEAKREEKRLIEAQQREAKLAEQSRENALLAEVKRQEESRIAEAKREEIRVAEAKRQGESRIAEARREEIRITEAKRQEESRIAEVKREEIRITEAKRQEESRVAEAKREEESRVAKVRREEIRVAEAKREEERVAEYRKQETARVAEAKRQAEMKGTHAKPQGATTETQPFRTPEPMANTNATATQNNASQAFNAANDFGETTAPYEKPSKQADKMNAPTSSKDNKKTRPNAAVPNQNTVVRDVNTEGAKYLETMITTFDKSTNYALQQVKVSIVPMKSVANAVVVTDISGKLTGLRTNDGTAIALEELPQQMEISDNTGLVQLPLVVGERYLFNFSKAGYEPKFVLKTILVNDNRVSTALTAEKFTNVKPNIAASEKTKTNKEPSKTGVVGQAITAFVEPPKTFTEQPRPSAPQTYEAPINTDNFGEARINTDNFGEARPDLSRTLTEGRAFELNNIYYGYGDAELNDATKSELEPLVALMQQDRDMDIEVAAHTDSRGKAPFNLNLSQLRADNIKSYLVEKGLSPDRIRSIGYGETRLKNRCADNVECTEEEHQINRRTEIRVINGGEPINARPKAGYTVQRIGNTEGAILADASTSLTRYLSDAATPTRFLVVVGTYSKPANAEKQRQKVLASGFVETTLVQFQESELYGVCVRQFDNFKEAQTLANYINSQKEFEAFVKELK